MFKALEIPFSFTLLLSCSFGHGTRLVALHFLGCDIFWFSLHCRSLFGAFTWFALVRSAFLWLGLALMFAAWTGVVHFLHVSHSSLSLSSLDEP
jgi:hypothetical protein